MAESNCFKFLVTFRAKMIKHIEKAKQLSDMWLEMFYRIDASCTDIKATVPELEAAAYLKAVSSVTGAIVMDVLEPLYDLHPELKPLNWDDDPAGIPER